MKTFPYNTFAVLLIFFLAASCKEIRKSIEETLHPKAEKKAASPDGDTFSSTTTFSSSSVSSSTHEQTFTSLFESAETLDSIQQLLYDIPGLKGKELHFLNGLYFYDYRGGVISVDLQDPNKPENVDTYTYSNGEWQIQRPVTITGNGHFPLKLLLAPLDDVKFSTAKKVYDIAVEKSKTIEGAEPTQHIYFTQINAVHVKEWYVMISGARRRYRITFDVNGRMKEMRTI